MRRLFLLAFRNLTRNQRRTLLSLTAIMFGIGAMVTFRGMVNGQRRMMLASMVQGQLGALQVHKTGYVANVQSLPLSFDFEDTEALRKKIASVEGVTAVAPRIAFGGMLSTPDEPNGEAGKATFFVVTAIDPAVEQHVTPERLKMLSLGRTLSGAGANEIILGSELAKSSGLKPLAPELPLPPIEQMAALLAADRDGALNGENVALVGELDSPMPGDRRIGLVPLGTAQRLLRMEGRITEYALAVKDPTDLAEVEANLKRALGPDLEVHAWGDLVPFVSLLMAAQDRILGMVGTIFLVIVLLGILNSMLMNVLERVREIGTMLAVGMRRRQIIGLLVLEGTALGIGGGALGVALGGAITWYLNARGIHINMPGSAVESTLRPYLTAPIVVAAMISAVIGASLAALWPAYHASRLRPVEALRSA